MTVRLHFDDDVLWESIYDTISQFFQDQDNVEGILGDDKFRIIGALADDIKYIISDTFPSEVKMI